MTGRVEIVLRLVPAGRSRLSAETERVRVLRCVEGLLSDDGVAGLTVDEVTVRQVSG